MVKAPGAVRLLVVVAVVAAGLGLTAAPAAAAPALTVTPSTGLLDRQVVTVTGSGFTPGERLVVAQCPGTTLDGCDLNPPVNTTGAYATAGADGTISATLRLSRVLGGGVSCAEVDCAVVAVTAPAPGPRTERARSTIAFAATGTAPPPPDATLAISVPDMRANGGAATWSGSGYLPWFATITASWILDSPSPPATFTIGTADYLGAEPGAYVSVCTAPPAGWAGCERIVVEGSHPFLGVVVPVFEDLGVAPDGDVAHTQPLPRMLETWDGWVDCAVEDCSFALEQDGAPRSNVVDVAWAPEWSPWPSAQDFVTAAYAALVGRGPTAGERATAVAGLTDRSLTGFTLLRQLAGRANGLRLAELTRLYQAALDRRPDAAGLLHWAAELRRTGSMTAIAGAFGRTPELRQAFGPSVSTPQAVVNAYRRTLHRDPSWAEIAYWVGRLQAGMSRTHMIHLFSRVPEFLRSETARSEITALIVALLGRTPTPGEWAASHLWNGGGARADDLVLDLLSSDELVAEVG